MAGTSVILAFRRLRQEGCCEFETSLGHIGRPLKENKTERGENGKQYVERSTRQNGPAEQDERLRNYSMPSFYHVGNQVRLTL